MNALRMLLVLVFGAFVATATPAAEPTRSTITVGNLERDFLLYVPDGLPAESNVPLVFVFHGGGGNARGTMNLTRFNTLADTEKFVVVYPQGVGGHWNDGRRAVVSQAHRDGIDDLAFFDATLDAIARGHRIDRRRVYAAGISNGGIYTHYLAAHRARDIAAIAPVAGGIAEPFDQRFAPAVPVAVAIVQGTDDPLVPYGGGAIVAGGRLDRGSIVGTDRAARLWVQANGCDAEPTTETLPDRDPDDACRVHSTTWSGCRNGTAVRLYRVEGGGHTWPGGGAYLPRRVIGRVTHDIDSRTLWEFFKAHPKH